MTEVKDEGHEETEVEHVEAGSEPAAVGANESPVQPTDKEGAGNGKDDRNNGREHEQQRPEVPVEATLASVNRYNDPESTPEPKAFTEAKRILMPATAIYQPSTGIFQHLTENDGIQKVLAMCMKYADVGIKYPVGPKFVRDNACIIDKKVMLYMVPFATVTEIEVWFVAKEQCLVRGVFTLELLDNETLLELEGEFVKHIASYVQNRRLH